MMNNHTEDLGRLLTLDGKTALVTGAAVGIGRSIATYLAQAGASVVLVDTDLAAAQITAKELTEVGLAALAVSADVSVESEVQDAVDAAVAWTGGIDILVNNAGVFPTVPVLDMTAEAFSRVLDVNLKGVYLVSRLVARQMVVQARGGRIINVTSVDALHPSSVGLAHYDASKHGVW